MRVVVCVCVCVRVCVCVGGCSGIYRKKKCRVLVVMVMLVGGDKDLFNED